MTGVRKTGHMCVCLCVRRRDSVIGLCLKAWVHGFVCSGCVCGCVRVERVFGLVVYLRVSVCKQGCASWGVGKREAKQRVY